VVTHGDNGLVFSAGDAVELQGRINAILSNESLYKHLTDNGRRSVINKFDWHTVGARYLTIMKQCISTPDA
jgi:glycosyltransferase involved in cell wall biosynthesis